jgi:hypothetical protein
MFANPVLIFEDEDEAALKSRFVEVAAKFPEHTMVDVAVHVFRNLRDPLLRAQDAAVKWGNDLEIKERIRQARILGAEEGEPLLSRPQRIKALEQIALNHNLEAKDRIAAFRLIAEQNGEVIKAVDKKVEKKPMQLPTIVHRIHPSQLASSGE